MTAVYTPRDPTFLVSNGSLMTAFDASEYMQFKLAVFFLEVLPHRGVLKGNQNVPATVDQSITIKRMTVGADGAGSENNPKYILKDPLDDNDVYVFENKVGYLIKANKGAAFEDLDLVRQNFLNGGLRYYEHFGKDPFNSYRASSNVSDDPIQIDLQSWEAGARFTLTMSYLTYFKPSSQYGSIDNVGIGTSVDGSGGIVIAHGGESLPIFEDGIIPPEAESTDTYIIRRTDIINP